VWHNLGSNKSKNNNSPLSLLQQILTGHGCSWDEKQVADCRQRLHDLMVHYHTHHAAAAAAAAGQHQRGEQPSETEDPQRIQSPVSVVVEVVDLTKMAKKQKTGSAATPLTIDITTANATDATATHHHPS
jgi:hypothetical protein